MWKIRLLGGLYFFVAACASTPSTNSTAERLSWPNTPPAGCVSGTATRIPNSPSECAAFGRAWTGRDIKSTGAADSGQALRLLDPSISVSGN
jgi:hypothetical protein